jgi:ADP-ribosylglycohydrolase
VILHSGLAQIPHTSRLHESVTRVITAYKSGTSCEDIFAEIHVKYDEHTAHGWCHTISNAMIVAMALLYGGGDFGRSICMAVQTGFDTDCNGATVGSVLGMRGGSAAIGEEWSAPLRGQLDTTIFGVGTVTLAEMAAKTMEHMKK